MWPRFDLQHNYLATITSVERLVEAGIDLQVAELLASDSKQQQLQVSDLAPALYLHHLANGMARVRRHKHIVVDEGQDLGLLQFELLRMHSAGVKPSFTIVGDVAQSIRDDTGITNWDDLRSVFGNNLRKHSISKNYRSTAQVIEVANDLLSISEELSENIAQPFDRQGAKPVLRSGFASTETMLDALANDLRQAKANEIGPVAVLAKTPEQAKTIEQALKVRKISQLTHLESNAETVNLEGHVIVVPIILAKGLEFSAVYIPFADSETYSPHDQADVRKLYVAATRALHSLTFYAAKGHSEILNTAIQRGALDTVYQR